MVFKIMLKGLDPDTNIFMLKIFVDPSAGFSGRVPSGRRFSKPFQGLLGAGQKSD